MTNCLSDTAERHLCGILSALPSAIRLSDRVGHRGIKMQLPDRLFVHCSWCQSSSSSRVKRLLTRRATINERSVWDVVASNEYISSQNGYGATSQSFPIQNHDEGVGSHHSKPGQIRNELTLFSRSKSTSTSWSLSKGMSKSSTTMIRQGGFVKNQLTRKLRLRRFLLGSKNSDQLTRVQVDKDLDFPSLNFTWAIFNLKLIVKAFDPNK